MNEIVRIDCCQVMFGNNRDGSAKERRNRSAGDVLVKRVWASSAQTAVQRSDRAKRLAGRSRNHRDVERSVVEREGARTTGAGVFYYMPR